MSLLAWFGAILTSYSFSQAWRKLIRTDGKPNADDNSLKATIQGARAFLAVQWSRLCFHCRGYRFNSWPGKVTHAKQCGEKNYRMSDTSKMKHHWSAGMVVTVSHDSREWSPCITYRTSALRLQEPVTSKTSRGICTDLIQNCFGQNVKKKKKKPSFFSWLSSIPLCIYKTPYPFICSWAFRLLLYFGYYK